MKEYIGKMGLYDGKIIELSEITQLHTEYFSIYEVVRIEQGVPLFLYAHLERLFHSLSLESLVINETQNTLSQEVNELIEENEYSYGKIKFVFYFPEYPQSHDYHYLVYFTEAIFPERDQYQEGVEVGICQAVRNDPNAKVMNTAARKLADQRIKESNVFEVLLVDDEGYITEGSRSNVFFIFKDQLVTPPDEAVLQGIARKNVIKICKEYDIPLEIRKVHRSELQQAESIFLTGTSLKVLPVEKIDNFKYRVNSKLLVFLMSAYDQKIEKHISNKLT
jgi:branched-chain amino acid aminotransferase